MDEPDWGLRTNEVKRIRGVLSAHPEVSQAIVYGSRAMGTHRPGSDIDLTLRGPVQWADLQRIETELDSLDMPYKIDLSIESQIENPELLSHIKRHGQTFYEQSADAS
ncbi:MULTISPECIES: nucleotidyltransferase domain-containing protein [unclassified Wenzhouxiangella]|uniref:nucleotidyltransferase domain-containing protein n=1 Tax=unclassified Wenzhouxiangella TaxID=2613841 RepID=UPI000E32668F|nr:MULTISPECIES: nucleotidyltransferase domain-containing protein [unclassified Wenzhouxiangella]RFF27858.1 nucleotidyltransferase domain-containing protein [Wenzhouxiangella sp. 15181]RFP69015.1 nucleotidyltransferase domain-containing protein [Wenzhouxiangella sp. 15190]